MRVLIIGRTEGLFNTALEVSKEHKVCGIITARAASEYKKKSSDFKNLAKELNCPFIETQKFDENTINFINQCKPEIAVSINWVSVINEDVTKCFQKGILNAHFGDLPKYRGNAATNWSLIRREKEIYLTVHFMVPGELDSGDIISKKRMLLDDTTTIKDIVDFTIENTPIIFREALNLIESGSDFISQDSLDVTPFRCYPRLPVYSKIDWNETAENIHALIRASTKPYSGAFTYLMVEDEIKKIFIWKSRLISKSTNDVGIPGHIIRNDKNTGESHVITGKGVVAISECQYDEGEIFQPGNTWKSIRINFGIDVEDYLIRIQNKLNQKV